MLLWSQCLTNVTSPSLFPSSVWGGGGVFGPSGHRLPGHWPLPAGHQRLWQRQLPQRAAVVQRSVGQRVAGLHSLQHSRRAVRGEVSVLKPAPLLENTSPFSASFGVFLSHTYARYLSILGQREMNLRLLFSVETKLVLCEGLPKYSLLTPLAAQCTKYMLWYYFSELRRARSVRPESAGKHVHALQACLSTSHQTEAESVLFVLAPSCFFRPFDQSCCFMN